MSALTLFLTGVSTGLVAGGASCAAVQGGLLAGAVARRGGEPESPSIADRRTELVGVEAGGSPPPPPPRLAEAIPAPGAAPPPFGARAPSRAATGGGVRSA